MDPLSPQPAFGAGNLLAYATLSFIHRRFDR